MPPLISHELFRKFSKAPQARNSISLSGRERERKITCIIFFSCEKDISDRAIDGEELPKSYIYIYIDSGIAEIRSFS